MAQYSLGSKHRFEVGSFVNLFVKAHRKLKLVADQCAKVGQPAGEFDAWFLLSQFEKYQRDLPKSLVPESFPPLNCSESLAIAVDYWLDRGRTDKGKQLLQIIDSFAYCEMVIGEAKDEWSEGHPEEPPTIHVMAVFVDELVSARVLHRPYGVSDRYMSEES